MARKALKPLVAPSTEYSVIIRLVEERGKRSFYCEVWVEGRNDPIILSDQVIKAIVALSGE
jgi:hypothetical protein